MKKHINIKIHGQVQGVSFRYYSQDLAGELGLAGFVRNESDGTLYIEVEGEKEKLDEFMEWCRKGPGSAQVEKVEMGWGEVMGYKDFVIK
ncbi:acylphosphatase [Candidatus Falkowbacteria bacterium]|nr:acylphosphatase [Candidatus Falkowbacteria bacterium]